MNPSPVRVRFAPSPTGPLHIGGIRTALYNYLFARQQQGSFIVRIEDTDPNRFVPQSEDYIRQTLDWLRITPDESPWHTPTPWGPYRQSERKAIYHPYALALIEKDKAYYAFDTPTEIEAMRKRQQAIGVPSPKYNAITRMSMNNSLTRSAQEVQRQIKAGTPYVIRMKINPRQTLKFKDQVRGWIQVQGNTLDDKIIFKSDGMPTYHLAHIVDDHLMQVTHVIRGEEWLPSTPLHTLIYQSLGWPLPLFIHLPLILNPDGQGKLSKRATHSSTLTLPIDWQDPQTQVKNPGFREAGYLPDALINFLALMGWHPTGDQEIFTPKELISTFSIHRIKRSGIRFDMHKAIWLNAQHLRNLPDTLLIDRYLRPPLAAAGCHPSEEYITQVCHLAKKRATFPQDLWSIAAPFFIPPTHYEKPFWQDKSFQSIAPIFADCQKQLQALTTWDSTHIQKEIKTILAHHSVKPSQVIPLLRIALIGTSQGPHITDILTLLGQRATLHRLQVIKTP